MHVAIPVVLLHVDPKTFYFNLFLILIAVLSLIFLFFSTIAAISLFRAWRLVRKQRLAEAKWQRASRRADGKQYPCRIPGVCDLCRRGGNHIFIDYGRNICPSCYEPYWRSMENWSGPDEKQELVSSRARRAARRAAARQAANGR